MADIAARFTPGLLQAGALGTFLLVVLALVLLGAWIGGRRRLAGGPVVALGRCQITR